MSVMSMPPSVRGEKAVGRGLTCYHRYPPISGTSIPIRGSIEETGQESTRGGGKDTNFLQPTNILRKLGDKGIATNDVFIGVNQRSGRRFISDREEVLDEVERMMGEAGYTKENT